MRRVIQEDKYARCWDGYEKVPGKKRGEPGSCRKKTREHDEYDEVDELMEVDEYDEGNAFSGARQDAIDAGKDEFEVDGKKYKVTGNKKKTNE